MKLVFGVIATLLLVAVIGIGAWAYTPDLSASRLKAIYLRPDDQFIDVLGVNLRVRISGPAQAPAVILLHGFGSSLETWEPWAETLSQHFRVIRFDLPGFGLTGTDPSGNYSDARTVQILAALMDHLGLAQASLVGNSLGGKIAWNFAVAYPGRVTKLVLISPDGFASPGFDYNKTPQVPALLNLLPYTLPRIMLRMNLTPAYADPARLTNATVTRYWDMMRGPGDRRAMLARMSQVMLVPPAPLLRQITAPTLLLWGEQDQMIPISNAQDYLHDIPNAKLVALAGLGHVPFEEDPAKSLPPVLAFLEGK
jgi:pimeloyl-ACP methyl ester carboxylesterase